jgi:hypothetical protein
MGHRFNTEAVSVIYYIFQYPLIPKSLESPLYNKYFLLRMNMLHT